MASRVTGEADAAEPPVRPRVAIIAHREAPIHWDGLARWVGTWASLVGIEILDEPRHVLWKRLRRERRRVGVIRLLDVLAFRAYYAIRFSRRDSRWAARQLERLQQRYPPVPAVVPIVSTASPNSAESETFLRSVGPDLVLALCKHILAERVFSIPTHGTFVLHPGVCPQYRNAHGCFWALASDDVQNVGMTLLRVDRGIDTGPVYGMFGVEFDEVRESHVQIQTRAVLDNLDRVAETLLGVVRRTVHPVVLEGRPSAVWGQPWLTRWWRWKRHARARARGNAGG